MSERVFQMRLDCRYQTSDNKVADLRVEHLEEGEWKPFDLHLDSPGFQVFVYAAFTCQHLYFRANCAERGLVLESATGSILVATDENWGMIRLHVDFEGRLRSGTPAQDDLDYLVERMGQCPVSTNVKRVADSKTVVRFV